MENDKKTKQGDTYQFLKLLAIGFTIVSFLVSIAIIGYILVSIKNQPRQDKKTVTSPTILPPSPTDLLNR